MSRVVADITISLDGFVTVLERSTAATGAVIMGRHLFDVIDGPHGWSDERGYGADQAATPPFFVVTSSRPERVRLAATHDFTFVLDGPVAAVELARAAAGERDVYVMGGAQVVRACLEAGVVDELLLHLSPLVLGGGTPLFEGASRRQLTQREVLVSPLATHLTYDVTGPATAPVTAAPGRTR